MKFKIFHIGKAKSQALKAETEELYKRIKRFADVEEIIIPDLKNAGKLSPVEFKLKEGKAILSALSDSDHVILLDERGKEHDSRGFAGMLERHFMDMRKPVIIVTGGAYGFSDEVYKRASQKVSLSKMTFSHQVIRLIFAEQLYRAMTIIAGHPYHND